MHQAQAYAARTGRTLSQVVEEAVAKLLSAQAQRPPVERITLPPAVGGAKKMSEAQYQAIVRDLYKDEAEHIALPVAGDPNRGITVEPLKAAAAPAELDHAMKKPGLERRAERPSSAEL